MGKGSKNRVKGNLRPASSTSAAEALSSAPSLSSSSSPSLSPAGAAAVFNPFEAAGAVYSTAGSPAPHRGQLLSSSTTSLAVSGTQLDANLVVLVRNLSKRAPTTKVRALDELNAYVDGNDDGALAGLAVVWPKLFNRLAGDTDRRVRQAAHAAHRNLTCRLGRRVAPMLREISGTWVSGRFDTHREVAKAATDSLAGVFPGGKLKDALAFCQAELLKYSRENALEKTAEMLSDPRFTSSEDMEGKYIRVVSSSLRTLSFLLDSLDVKQIEDCRDDYTQIFESEAFWAKATDERPAVRSAFYTLIKSACLEWKDILADRLETASPVILCKSFNDSDRSCHPELWVCVITFVQVFPRGWEIANQQKKPARRKLINFLEHHGPSSAAATYPSLLAFLAALPSKVLTADPAFARDFLAGIWRGAGTVDKTGAVSLLSAYLECFYFFLLKLGDVQSEEHKREIELLILGPFWRTLSAYLFLGNVPELLVKIPSSTLASTLASYVTKLRFSKNCKESFVKLWALFGNTLVEMADTGEALLPVDIEWKEPINDMEVIVSRACDLLAAVQSAEVACPPDAPECGDFVDSLVVRIYRAAISRCARTSDPPAAVCLFASRLAKEFKACAKDTVRQNSVTFVQQSVPTLLGTCSETSASYMIDLFATFLSDSWEADHSSLRSSWECALQTAIGIPGESRRLSVMYMLLSKITRVPVQFPFINPVLDEYVLDMVERHTDHTGDEALLVSSSNIIAAALAPSGGQANYATIRNGVRFRPLTGGTFRGCRVLGDRAFKQVLLTLVARFEAALQSIFLDERKPSASELSPALAGFYILLKCWGPEFLEAVISDAQVAMLLATLFDFQFVSHQAPVENPGHVESLMDALRAKAVECWSAIASASAAGEENTNRLRHMIVRIVAERIKISLRNISYAASPTSFAQRVAKLLELVEDPSPWISDLLLERELWNSAFGFFQQTNSGLLSVIDPMAFAFAERVRYSSAEGQQLALSYDAYGLSMYGRLVLYAVEVAKAFGPIQTFTVERLWVLAELLKGRQLCVDTLALLPSAGPALWDAAVHVAENIDIFQGFVRDVVSLVNAVISGELATGILDVGQPSFLACAVMHGAADSGTQKSSVLSGLVAQIAKDAEQDAQSFRIMRTLLQWISDAWPASIEDQEGWVQLLTAAVESIETSKYGAALAVSWGLGPQLRSSPQFQRLQTLLLDRLNAMDQLSDVEAAARISRHLCLLRSTLSGPVPAAAFLTPQRAVFCMQTVRRWYEGGEPPLEIAVPLVSLMRSVADSLSSTSGDFWDFMLSRCEQWLKQPGRRAMPLRHEALQLVGELQYLSQSNSDLYEVITIIKERIFTAVLELLLRATDELYGSRAEAVHCDVVAEIGRMMPQKVLLAAGPVQQLCGLLRCAHDVLQVCAYELLRRMLVEKIQSLAIAIEMQPDTNEEEKKAAARIAGPLMILASKPPEGDPADAIIPRKEHSEPNLIGHSVLGYLLSWMCILDHFEVSTFQLKGYLVEELREESSVEKLLPFMFNILGLADGRTPFQLTKWQFDDYAVEGIDLSSEFSLPLLAAHIYLRLLRHCPAIVRNWWLECKNRQLSLAVEKYTEKHFSPILIVSEIDNVQQASVTSGAAADDNEREVTVRASRVTNEVTASCEVDEQVLSLTIRLPQNYPLRQVEVEGTQRAGVTDARWRAWMLGAHATITSQNGSIQDAVTLFQRNVRLHFQGVEDCTICYSIILSVDRSLPTKTCRTCKKSFHSACLFKWFRTSNSSSCPLCRGEW